MSFTTARWVDVWFRILGKSRDVRTGERPGEQPVFCLEKMWGAMIASCDFPDKKIRGKV